MISKTYVLKLESQLKQEIEKRKCLEEEIAEMRKMNLEIAKRIGIK